ncbi:MAG: chorismate mutase [Patescibacteria group bacterium]|jgi:chorismate mutase
MKNQINILRKQIDEIDNKIVILLAKRMKIVTNIGLLKKKQNILIFDLVRWKKVIESKKGYIKKIWEIIHKEALEIEKSI